MNITTKPKRLKIKKVIPPYRGIPCDSYSEQWTLQWLFELKQAGYISTIERASSYLLFKGQDKSYIKRLKTRGVPLRETLLGPHLYTPDFKVILTEKGRNLSLFMEIGSEEKYRQKKGYRIIHQDGIIHIETKGTMIRTMQDTTEKFKVDQKWLWEKHGIYVNLFKPDDVFPKTFTPKEFLFTPTGRKREIKWKVKSLYSFTGNKR